MSSSLISRNLAGIGRSIHLLNRSSTRIPNLANDVVRFWSPLSQGPPNRHSSSLKERLAKGPSLKDFIESEAKLNAGADSNQDELVTNQILQQTIVHEADSNPLPSNRKVFYEIHGCQMNFNDIEIVNSILNKTGHYTQTKDEKDADVILIMTCSIRDNAEQKIWTRLKDFLVVKQKRARQQKQTQIGILGCMAERLKRKIVEKEKQIDIVAGPDSYRSLPSLLEKSWKSHSVAMNVQLSLEETYAEIQPLRVNPESKKAFVSIQRGCDNMCSFCIVPFVRGRERSRPVKSILEEVRQLSDAGIKEVTLLGQNVNSYLDQSEINFGISDQAASSTSLAKGFKENYKRRNLGGKRFTDLLHEVSLVDPEMRVRFTSPHPKDFPDDLLYLIKDRANICKTLHVPAQSGNTNCLDRMRRGYSREAYLDLVEKIRQLMPDIALTTDMIAGFCGETEEEHADSISLMNLVKYTYCFVYSYSMREKTRAHHRLKDDVPQEVKDRRYREMIETFRTLATDLNQTKIGQTHLVLIDQISKRSENEYSGRNDNNTLVIFPKTELPLIEDPTQFAFMQNSFDSQQMGNTLQKRVPTIGDYVACKIVSATSQSMRAIPLYTCKLQTFHRISSFKTTC